LVINKGDTQMTFKGYKFEKTSPRHWFVTSKVYGTCMGPFRTRKHALEYAIKVDTL
jgi:hypothetical protein